MPVPSRRRVTGLGDRDRGRGRGQPPAAVRRSFATQEPNVVGDDGTAADTSDSADPWPASARPSEAPSAPKSGTLALSGP